MSYARSLTFQEIFDLIMRVGSKVSVLVQGEPGCGKTTLGKRLAAELGYHFAYMDVANMSLGDLMMPVTNRDSRSTEFYPNEVFGLHLGKPVIVLLDEWTKGSREVKNMTLPLVHERRLGCIHLHPDSIVFATGNLAGDGVGDRIEAHQLDRFVLVEYRKPSAEEWINNYAIPNQLNPILIAFVNEYPNVLASYREHPDNEYIFNPQRAQSVFCSPRSLEFASYILDQKDYLTEAALRSALIGTIGAPAAAELMGFVNLQESLPKFKDVIAYPLHTDLPKTPVTCLLMTFNLIIKSDSSTIGAITKYMGRMSAELQGIFVNRILSIPSKSTWATQCKDLGDMCVKNNYLFSN